MQRKKGFTLIELLVVIAIIAILAAILFPVFAQAREKARATSCLSNEKQIGLAFVQYTQDFDEYYPSTAQYGTGWLHTIYPYVKSYGVFQCPDDTFPLPTSYITLPADTIKVSYTANSYIMSTNNGETYNIGGNDMGIPYALAKLDAPSNSVLIYEGDANQDQNGTKGLGRGWFSLSAYNANPGANGGNGQIPGAFGGAPADNSVNAFGNHDKYGTSVATYRHQPGQKEAPLLYPAGDPSFTDGKNNYIMCDGHAKFLDWNNVSNNDNSSPLATPDKLGRYAATFAASDDEG